MNRFEITINGTVQPGDFATQAEADKAAEQLRQVNQGKTVAVRQKASQGSNEPQR